MAFQKKKLKNDVKFILSLVSCHYLKISTGVLNVRLLSISWRPVCLNSSLFGHLVAFQYKLLWLGLASRAYAHRRVKKTNLPFVSKILVRGQALVLTYNSDFYVGVPYSNAWQQFSNVSDDCESSIYLYQGKVLIISIILLTYFTFSVNLFWKYRYMLTKRT